MKNIKNIIEQKYPPENPNDLWMKDNVLYKSTHKGWTPLTAGGGSLTNGVTSTTWLELKDKRDAGKLIPGSLYRITDYQCTTTQENTQSAGHQFDIVLLALSENKLAEEGWAMEHPTDVYDVTFADGVTKKCYIYHTMDEYNNSIINVVDIETKLGLHCGYIEGDSGNLVTIDENAKTASTEEYDSIDLTGENLTYNYFQNSKLEAWKVWYCLDNDKSRFAWADDSVDILYITLNNGARYSRKEDYDVIYEENTYFAWYNPSVNTIYTLSQIPTTSDKVFMLDKGGNPEEEPSYSILNVHQGTGLPNGRGVIYRLIDEWNNDVPYDFKNIQFYDDSLLTEVEWLYTFVVGEIEETVGIPIDADASMLNVKDFAPQPDAPSCAFQNANKIDECKSSLSTGPCQLLKNTFTNISDYNHLGAFCSNITLNRCSFVSIGEASNDVILTEVTNSSFGKRTIAITLTDNDLLNYGNGGVELATKDDLN